MITTVVGTGTASYSGDGDTATSAALNGPVGVAVDSSGNLYIADMNNHRVRKVTMSTGIITTIAGTGTGTYNYVNNGDATSASLYYPNGVALDSSGNVYIADTSNQRIRKVTVSTGIITNVAGNNNNGWFSGDGGSATSARFFNPRAVALDASDNFYVADDINCRIRKVTASTGIITTIAGTGVSTYSGDGGQATSAGLTYPYGVNVDSSGSADLMIILNYLLTVFSTKVMCTSLMVVDIVSV